jgi:hypothetical protein
MLAASWAVILLFWRTNSVTLDIFLSVLLGDGCLVSSAASTPALKLVSYSELVFFLLLSKSYFQHLESFCSIFPKFQAKFIADVLFQGCHFIGMPKSQIG